MRERIFLTYTNASALPYHGAVLGHHVVLNYIDATGIHHTLEGVPERKFDRNAEKLVAFLREESQLDGTRNTDSPFRRLRAKEAKRIGDVVLDKPHTLIASGDDLSSQWDQMKRFGGAVNATGYEYRPYSQNSNSFAAGALKRAGLLGPGTSLPEVFDRLVVVDSTNGRTHSVGVPGFDRRLTNPLNLAVPSLDAVPFVPANSSLSNDRRDSFDERFESRNPSAREDLAEDRGRPSWQPSIGNRSATGAKSERTPASRMKGSSEVSVFDRGASALPFIPFDGIVSSPRSTPDRFGSWTSSPAVSAPRSAYSPGLVSSETPPGIAPGKPEVDLPFLPTIWDSSEISSSRSEGLNDLLFGLLRFKR